LAILIRTQAQVSLSHPRRFQEVFDNAYQCYSKTEIVDYNLYEKQLLGG